MGSLWTHPLSPMPISGWSVLQVGPQMVSYKVSYKAEVATYCAQQAVASEVR